MNTFNHKRIYTFSLVFILCLSCIFLPFYTEAADTDCGCTTGLNSTTGKANTTINFTIPSFLRTNQLSFTQNTWMNQLTNRFANTGSLFTQGLFGAYSQMPSFGYGASGFGAQFGQYYAGNPLSQLKFNTASSPYLSGTGYMQYGSGFASTSYNPFSSYGSYQFGVPFNPYASTFLPKKPSSNKQQPAKPAEPTVYVNIQIDAELRPGADGADGLVKIIDELKSRNVTTTVYVTGEFANDSQLLVTDIYNDGFEIALHGYRTGEQLATMGYTEQKERLTQAKQALEGCMSCGTYKPVVGFRPQYFSQDPNTYRVLDELGLTYNCGFKVGQEPYVEGHMDDTWPFRMEGYDFCVLPISKGEYNGEAEYLCDIAVANVQKMSAADWGAMLSSALDHAIAFDEPLVILFHNWYTGLDMAPNQGETGYWQPFVDFLDEAESKGASFITSKRLVEDFCN